MKRFRLLIIAGFGLLNPVIIYSQNIESIYKLDSSIYFDIHKIRDGGFLDFCQTSSDSEIFVVFQQDIKVIRRNRIKFKLYSYNVNTRKSSTLDINSKIKFVNVFKKMANFEKVTLHSLAVTEKYILLSLGTYIISLDRSKSFANLLNVNNSFIINDLKDDVAIGSRIYNSLISDVTYKSSCILLNLKSFKYTLNEIPRIKNVELSYFIPNNWFDASIKRGTIISMDPNSKEIQVLDLNMKLKNKYNLLDSNWVFLDSSQMQKWRELISPRNPGAWIDTLKDINLKISKIVDIAIISDSIVSIYYYLPKYPFSRNQPPNLFINQYALHSNQRIQYIQTIDCNIRPQLAGDYIKKNNVLPIIYTQPFINVGIDRLVICREWFNKIPVFNISRNEANLQFLKAYENNDTEYSFWIFNK